jgi:hypothetical protein
LSGWINATLVVVAGVSFQPLACLADAPGTQLDKTIVTDGGTFKLHLRTQPNPLPHNELFELLVDVQPQRELDDPNPLWLNVNATMPGHGHGMNTHGKIEALDSGHFVVRGMLFHMDGEWQLVFDVAKGAVREQAKTLLTLE